MGSTVPSIAQWQGIFHKIGIEAELVARKWYGTEKARREIGRGAGGDTTVWLDKALEDIIIKRLKPVGNLRLITEEAGILEFGDPKVTVIADPLDGSTNAKHGIPMFAVSLALAGKEPTLGSVKAGYVRNLIAGNEFTAVKGGGAWRDGKKLATSKNTNVKLLSLEFHPHTPETLRKSVQFISTSEKVRSLGSIALDLCYTASGIFDAVVDFRDRIRLLDISAGKLILEEAGGIITDLRGKSIDPHAVGENNRLSFIAAGNKTVHGKMLALCRA